MHALHTLATLGLLSATLLLRLPATACTQTEQPQLPPNPPATPQTTFTNPLWKGADPWVTKVGDKYYTCKSAGGGVQITESRYLTKIEKSKIVWKTPKKGWNATGVWAPEVHYIDGKWYVYYAAGKESGKPYIHQRAGVLMSDTPLGNYKDMGMLHTGDDPQQRPEHNIWGIDMTVFQHKGKLYAVWSGWETQEKTDATNQNLYIAHMPTPTTIGKRVLLSKPQEKWEQGEHIALQEGPSVIQHEGNVFILYSTRGSWTVHYKLGQLRLKDGGDPLNPQDWTKRGPVFWGNKPCYGVGHASFTTSPDGTENWIYFHTKTTTEPGWTDRVSALQQFYYGPDGNPWLGPAIPLGTKLKRPSGEVETELSDQAAK